jgi:hypothetical protein
LINLRGEANKDKFIREHDIKPVSHQKLLKGQTKYSVGGGKLTDQYYCFLYNKKGQKQQHTFICGYSIAKRLLEKTNQAELPLFNPLKTGDDTVQGERVGDSNNNQHNNRRQWDAVAKQLSDAIGLFITYWDKEIDRILAERKLEVNQYYYNEPFDWKIKSVNTCLRRTLHDKTLKDIEIELSKDNDMKHYDFSLLNKILSKYDIPSQFG